MAGTVPALDNATLRRSLPPVIFALFVGALAKLLGGSETKVELPPVVHVLPADANELPLAAGRYRTPRSITPAVHFALPDSSWTATMGSASWRLERQKGGVIQITTLKLSIAQAETQLGRIRAIEFGEFIDTTFGTRAARQAEGVASSAVTLAKLGGSHLARGDRFRVMFADAGQSTLAVFAVGHGVGFLDFLKEAKRVFRTFRIV